MYYRLMRIIQDIGEYYEHIFLTNDSYEEKLKSLEYLKSNFLTGGAIDCLSE